MSSRTDPTTGDGADAPASAVEATPASAVKAPYVPPTVPHATCPSAVPRRASYSHPSLFFNRELSWLDFNWRVLAQALDERVPLMERIRFVSIASSNLDELFRKRVGGLKRQLAARVTTLTPDGRTPAQQLALLRSGALEMYATLGSTWETMLRPRLASQADVHIQRWDDLDEDEQERLRDHFLAHIFPILTPLAVDPGHPFPFISDLSLSFAIILRHPARGTEHFARLKVPTRRGRWLPLSDKGHFVPVEEVIRHNLRELFRGMEIVSASLFRITRNVEPKRDDEETDDLVEMIEDELRERRFAPVVRLEVEASMPDAARRLLLKELDLRPDDVYEATGLIDMSGCTSLASVVGAEHAFGPWEPVVPERLARRDLSDGIFGVIRERDLLVHHPYESFRASVQRFVEEAADDERVVAIKQTLYRTSDESPIIKALIRAAEAGKQVAVLVEVKARFDEERNLEWGEQLEEAGVHVTYGLVGLKTHSKVTLVVREEADRLRTYCHFGTGNYHAQTARFYTDLGLFTCQEEIGSDLVNLFHYLTGYAPEQHYRRLLIAPRDMRQAFVDLIRHEVALQKKHGNGHIIAKMNALDDVDMIQELYKASAAGVKIELIVRGHCRLRPGLERFSENITVRSIIGRFLEHSCVYLFGNGGEPRVFTGSADWQRRNLDDRVEVIVEVDDAVARSRMVNLLTLSLADERQSWTLGPDGVYTPTVPPSADTPSFQERLMRRARERNRADTGWDIG